MRFPSLYNLAILLITDARRTRSPPFTPLRYFFGILLFASFGTRLLFCGTFVSRTTNIGVVLARTSQKRIHTSIGPSLHCHAWTRPTRKKGTLPTTIYFYKISGRKLGALCFLCECLSYSRGNSQLASPNHPSTTATASRCSTDAPYRSFKAAGPGGRCFRRPSVPTHCCRARRGH